MHFDASSIGASFSHDQASDNVINFPSEAPRDLTPESLLLIQPSQRLLHVVESGLDLSHEQRSRVRVIRQVINRSSLAVNAVGDLVSTQPSGPRGSLSSVPRFLDCRMVGIKQPIQLAAAPDNLHEDPRVEGLEDATDRCKRT